MTEGFLRTCSVQMQEFFFSQGLEFQSDNRSKKEHKKTRHCLSSHSSVDVKFPQSLISSLTYPATLLSHFVITELKHVRMDVAAVLEYSGLCMVLVDGRIQCNAFPFVQLLPFFFFGGISEVLCPRLFLFYEG